MLRYRHKLQNAMFDLSIFTLAALKKIRHRAGYDSLFSTLLAQKSNHPKHSILKFIGSIFSSLAFLSLFFVVSVVHASTTVSKNLYTKPWFVGGGGGYGSTTWQGLVPAPENQNVALNISTPTWVNEGGAIWNVFAGYEVTPNFVLEADYTQYPRAHVFFDPDSLFAFEHDNRVELVTHTSTAALMAKFMVFIPSTPFRAYSSIGAARVVRRDEIEHEFRIAPTFGLGINYIFVPNLMGEIGANFTAGYGESELNPANDYIPFLFSVFYRMAYRFSL